MFGSLCLYLRFNNRPWASDIKEFIALHMNTALKHKKCIDTYNARRHSNITLLIFFLLIDFLVELN